MTEILEEYDAHKIQQARGRETLRQAWLESMVEGNQTTMGLLYDDLAELVYALALRITKRTALAEDVVQETFWQVWRQAPRFDPERGTVKTWVLTIARSRALDMLRGIDANADELEEETLELIEAADQDTPPNLLAALEQGRELETALAALDNEARQLLSLAFFRGLSHEEIAVCSGLPLGTVKSHIRRALQSLKHLLT